MESGTSYRKRFLWQIADSELKSIQVGIKRQNLRNPIKTTAPLTRLFDPELHTLIVHFTGPNTGRENIGLSIFDRPGVMCNKEATPDRTLEKERRAEDSASSNDSEVASPRIYRKNSNRKCYRDPFPRDEVMKKNSTKHNKNRTSKERGNRSNSNKDHESRPSTSGYNKNRTELSRNDPRLRKSGSNTPRSTGSVDLPPTVYDTQRGHTESSRKEKQHNQRSDDVDQYTSGSSHSARYNKRSGQLQYTARDDHQYHHQQQPSPKQRSRRSRSISTRSRSVRSVSSSRHYRNRETNTKYDRFKSRERNERSRSRSKSINESRTSRSKSTKKTARRSRSRSLTPLRRGEYRPGKRKRPSPQSRSRDDAGSQRPSQRNRMLDSNMQPPIIQPFDYPPMTMPYHQYGEYGAIFPGPRGGPMRYPSGGVPRPPHILPPPHHYAQYIQYVPVTALAPPPPHGRGGHLYPAHYQQSPRPNKVYNSRHIPQFHGNATAEPAGVGETNSGNTENVNETVNDRFSVTANIDNESVTIQLECGSDSLNHENPSSTSISTPVIAANLTPEQHVETDDRLTLLKALNVEGVTIEERDSPR